MGNPPNESLTLLASGATSLGISLDDAQLAAFARYRELLLDWNTHVNLTAITAPAEVTTRHFLDSLTIAQAVPTAMRQDAPRLLDVGAGAGFPGLPLAVVFPHWHVTLLEATGKKVRFMETVIGELELSNARAIHARAEELAHQAAYRGHFDLVTARAVAALPTLLEYCCPFARVGGLVITPKKGDLAAEITAGSRAAKLLGARLLDAVEVTVPPLIDGRVLLVAVQEKPCSPQYPRASGAPSKRPLG
ncbi:MAG TPA: 16S rRNA (guanine(527)-N(7))-methyltransferase RsmG, partial [Ktedonobacterales bacterium]